jgi:beta-lactamase regulating signal transducer with metallopeptidase domain
MPPDILMSAASLPESLAARWADLAAGWLLTYLVHSTLLLLSAWLITSWARTSDTVRDILWKCALVGGLVTATIQMGVAREPLAGQLRLAPRTGGERGPVMRVSVKDNAGGPARFLVTRPKGTRWTAGLVVLWLTSSGAGLLWLTIAHARSLRALGERTSLDGTPIGARLRALLRRTSVNRMVELTSSATLASPVALPGDEICLPRRALLELEPNEQDGMLAHEVAHLVRRDPQWLIVARAMEIVFFMQPLNRLARRRMQEVAEYLCDDWAVSRMSQPVTLARCLAAVAEWVSRAPRAHSARLHPMSAMVESGGSPLVRRVGRILDGHSAPHARSARLAVAASALALVALAGVAPRVSVAHAAGGVLADRTMTFVRAVAAGPRLRIGRDTMIVVEGGPRGVGVDSLVMRRRGAAVGGVLGRANVIVVERQPVAVPAR